MSTNGSIKWVIRAGSEEDKVTMNAIDFPFDRPDADGTITTGVRLEQPPQVLVFTTHDQVLIVRTSDGSFHKTAKSKFDEIEAFGSSLLVEQGSWDGRECKFSVTAQNAADGVKRWTRTFQSVFIDEGSACQPGNDLYGSPDALLATQDTGEQILVSPTDGRDVWVCKKNEYVSYVGTAFMAAVDDGDYELGNIETGQVTWSSDRMTHIANAFFDEDVAAFVDGDGHLEVIWMPSSSDATDDIYQVASDAEVESIVAGGIVVYGGSADHGMLQFFKRP